MLRDCYIAQVMPFNFVKSSLTVLPLCHGDSTLS